MSVVSLDEYRAQLEDERGEAADREYSLARAREAVTRYAGGPEIGEPEVDAGVCGHCQREAIARWQHGVFELCRGCRQRCALAEAHL